VEIAAEIEELKQHLETTTLELEERLEPITRRARWTVQHRRQLAIAAGLLVAALIGARVASRLR
jgi:hypothetical protein